MSLGTFSTQTVATDIGDLNLTPAEDVNLGTKTLKWIPTATTGSETKIIPLNGQYTNADNPITVLTIIPTFGTLGTFFTFEFDMTVLINTGGIPSGAQFKSFWFTKCISGVITNFGPFNRNTITETGQNGSTPELFLDTNGSTQILVKFAGLSATDINYFNALITIKSQSA